jgi:hypothetical protein
MALQNAAIRRLQAGNTRSRKSLNKVAGDFEARMANVRAQRGRGVLRGRGRGGSVVDSSAPSTGATQTAVRPVGSVVNPDGSVTKTPAQTAVSRATTSGVDVTNVRKSIGTRLSTTRGTLAPPASNPFAEASRRALMRPGSAKPIKARKG